jgi:hypothetical protein
MIKKGNKANFKTLQKAFKNGDVALMECTLKATGKKVDVICAVCKGRDPKFPIEMVPFAMLFNDNPYDLLVPPEGMGHASHL